MGFRGNHMSDTTTSSTNSWSTIGAMFVCIAIGMGAWAAHGLEKAIAGKYAGMTKEVAGQTVPAVTKYVGDFKTAADYQMSQGLGLVLLGLLIARKPGRALRAAGVCLLLGTLLFSGSLYVLVLTGITKLGAITPIGGLLLMVGWVLIAVGVCPCCGSGTTCNSGEAK
jgi:uncharacterized membrane protein YgdD (TMEM256/DUF423 family)